MKTELFGRRGLAVLALGAGTAVTGCGSDSGPYVPAFGAASGGTANASTAGTGSGGTANASTAGGGGQGGRSGAAAVGGTGGAAVGSNDSCNEASIVSNDATARDDTGRGEVTQSSVCVPGQGVVDDITLAYRMDSFFGEATRRAVFAYQADFSIGGAVWFAQVFSTGGQPIQVEGKSVYVSWLEGSWPEPGGEFGVDSTGSPSWGEVFSYYANGAARTGYVPEAAAKTIYRDGFTLNRLRMVSINDDPVLY